MHEHIVRYFQARKMQHRRPEQCMEIRDVLADEMVLLGRRIGHEGIEVAAGLAEIILQRREVADRRVEPDIEVLARRIRDFNAEVRCVAADVPVAEARIAFKPLARLVRDFLLQLAVERPAAQEFAALRV